MFRNNSKRTRRIGPMPGALALLPILLAAVTVVAPITASCQRSLGDAGRGIKELKALVVGASNKPAPADLARFEKKYPQSRAASLARFLRGYLHFSAQEYEQAVEDLDPKMIATNCLLGDYALFYRAQGLAATGSPTEAIRDYAALHTRYGDSLMAVQARIRLAELAIASGDPDTAIKELARLVELKDADAIYWTAQAYEASGKSAEAIELYRAIYYELPATAASVQAEARLTSLGASPSESPAPFEREVARAAALLDSNQHWEASRAYDQVVARFPQAEKSDDLQLRRGVALLGSKQPAQAATALAKVSNRDPDTHAEALFNLAEALRQSNRAGEAISVIDRLAGQYPKSRWTEEALYDLAARLDKQGRTLEATLRYRQLLALFPKSKYAPEASYQLGWKAYQSRNYGEAARALGQHMTAYRYPETKFIGEACLWAAKAEERLGNRSRALALYEMVAERYRYGYHGYIGSSRAAKLRAADPRLKAEIKPGSDLDRIRQNVLYVDRVQETADDSESSRVNRASDLEIIGLTDLAIKELNKALEGAPTSPRLNLSLARLYSGRGENFQATLVLRRGYPDLYSYRDSDVPREAWEIFFPLAEWDLIKQEARRYGIDPFLVAGLIRQESVFNPNAVSRAGARGLMQLMPSTGQLVARQQGTPRITAEDLFNPSLNIKLGMNYLAQMVGQFGRFEYAAAAYNAGPARAKRWVAERGWMDIEDWIEAIPISETRGYVQGVIRYAANYRRFYKE